MEFEDIVVKESPGLCRCCLSEGCYKDLGSEYTWMNETEVYADMLLECFDISITQHNDGPNGPNRLICEVCITRLRDACNFKKQVLDSEKKFIDMVARGEFRPKMVIYQAQLKSECIVDANLEDDAEYLEDDVDLGDDDYVKDESANEPTVSALPVKRKRGRPSKNSTVAKTEKKTKVAKNDDKPKTSKAVAKEPITIDADTSFKEDTRKQRELIKLLIIIIENSTCMPFRWSSNKYMCFYCCCSFVDSVKLKEHTSIEHKDAKLHNVLRGIMSRSRVKFDTSEIKCKRCPKIFESLEAFLDHASCAHGLTFDRVMSQSLFTFNLSDEGMFCNDCGEAFQFFGPLLKHAHSMHIKGQTFLCEICGRAFVAKANVDSHIKSVHSDYLRSAKCLKCNHHFDTPALLKEHIATAHKLDSLRCPKCPEVLTSTYLKKRHLALVHDVKKLQFACDQCDKVYTMKSRLLQHKLRIHLKEKKVTCKICGYKFFNNDLLKRHMVRHDDARPFQCEFCNKSFQRKRTLAVHTRIHTNDRRYVCKECGRAFVQTTSLKLHLRVHHST